jgi:two-component system response regulator CpxR
MRNGDPLKVLVIDADAENCESLKSCLSQEKFAVEIANSGADGMEEFSRSSFDLVILDVLLPGINGLEVLRQIHLQSDIPVILLTTKSSNIDRVIGLQVGADDYVCKPFYPPELMARIHAILRRTAHPIEKRFERENLIQIGEILLNKGNRSVFCAGESIELTNLEFNLLEILLRSAGQIVTRDEISSTVFQRQSNPMDRSIDVHISQLRKKLGTSSESNKSRIKTIRSVGYMYAPPSNEQ